MGTNLLAPNGLSVGGSRQAAGGAPNYSMRPVTIKKSYGTSLGRGDLVIVGVSAQQGYVNVAATNSNPILGVFGGVYPYYDTVAQATAHGLNGSYQLSSSPSADIPCWVIDDPFVTFIAQVSGGPFLQTWVGQNINFLNGSNGAPDTTGQSTLVLDGSSVNTTNTLPLRIVSVTGVVGGPRDPTFTNPWIEVRLNTASMLAPLGI